MGTSDRAQNQFAYLARNFQRCELYDRNEIKSLSKNLLKAYKEGLIEEKVFEELIERLMECYIEKSLEDKLSAKFVKMDNKLNKILLFSIG